MNLDFILEENWPKLGAGQHSQTTIAIHNWCGRLSSVVTTLVNRIKELENDKKKETDTLRKENDALKQSKNATSRWSEMFKTNKNSIQETVILAKVAKETKEKENKQNNIVIKGVPEAEPTVPETGKDEHDKTLINKILEQIQVDTSKVKRIRRIKKATNVKGPGIMVVEFSDKLEQNKALINSKRLKSSETFKEIYINKDLTTAEAELERVLRIERNNRNATLETGEGRLKYGKTNDGKEFYWGIRFGILRKIDKTTSKPIQF